MDSGNQSPSSLFFSNKDTHFSDNNEIFKKIENLLDERKVKIEDFLKMNKNIDLKLFAEYCQESVEQSEICLEIVHSYFLERRKHMRKSKLLDSSTLVENIENKFQKFLSEISKFLKVKNIFLEDQIDIIKVLKSKNLEDLRFSLHQKDNEVNQDNITSIFYCENNCTRSSLVQQSIKNFLLIRTETIDKFLLDIEDIDLPVNSNVVILTGDFETTVDIWDVYRPSPRSKVMYVKDFI